MKTYIATYQFEDTVVNATILLLPDNISIGFTDENGLHRKEIWKYKNISASYQKNENSTIITNTNNSNKIIIDDIDAVNDFTQQVAYDAKPWLSKKFTKSRIKMLGVLGILLALLVTAYFIFVPYLSEQLAKTVPKKYEVSLGNKLFDIIVDTAKKDEEKTVLLNTFFRQLEIQTDYPIRITVLKDNTVNAFAIMGGNIVVYTGLLDKIKTHEELAALLSHEFIHVNRKHTTMSIFRSLGSKVFLSLLLGNMGNLTNVVLNNTDQFTGLGYSRNLEKEADVKGLAILKERSINGQGFVDLMIHLKEGSGGVEVSEFLSSHPDITKRIAYLKSDKNFADGSNNTVNRNLKATFLQIKGGGNDF